jgi:hypothetical protein
VPIPSKNGRDEWTQLRFDEVAARAHGARDRSPSGASTWTSPGRRERLGDAAAGGPCRSAVVAMLASLRRAADRQSFYSAMREIVPAPLAACARGIERDGA